MNRRAQDALAAEAANDVEQSFQDEALGPAAQRTERGNSGRGVVSRCICLGVILEMDLLA